MRVCKAVEKGVLSCPKQCKVEVFNYRNHNLMKMIVATLQSIRSDKTFNLFFWQKIEMKCEKLPYSVTLREVLERLT